MTLNSLLYALDWQKIQQCAATSGKPVLPVSQLRKATVPDMEQSYCVGVYAFYSEGEWYLPLTNTNVCKWLSTLRFQSAPMLRFARSLVPCGKEVPV
jgi:hypothetical protein